MFRGVDFYNVDELLSDEDRLVRQSIREFLENEVAPLVADAWHEEKPLNFHVLGKSSESSECSEPSFQKNTAARE